MIGYPEVWAATSRASLRCIQRRCLAIGSPSRGSLSYFLDPGREKQQQMDDAMVRSQERHKCPLQIAVLSMGNPIIKLCTDRQQI
jgi:hypothetical protein